MEKKIKRVLFTGDSITDCNRARPIGDGAGSLGDSYVARLFTDSWADDPKCSIRYLNSATGGDTSRMLLARFDTDVIAHKPDYVFIMIGINDCWRNFDNPLMTERQVSPEEYKTNVEEMIKKVIAIKAVPVILSPFFLDLNRNEPMRSQCDNLNKILRELTSKYRIGYIDIQSAFDEYLKYASTYLLSGDRVHPNAIGHAIISRYIYRQPQFRVIFDE